MKKLLLSLLLCLTLTSCATASDYAFMQSQSELALEEAKTNTERMKSLGKFADSNDVTSKTIAAMALGNFGGNSQPRTQLIRPRSFDEKALDWARVLLGFGVQGYSTYVNGEVSMNASDNNRKVSLGSYTAFTDIAGKIQAPTPNITSNGSVVFGSGSLSSDEHNITGSYNPIDNSLHDNPIDNSNYNNPVTN